MVEFRILGSLEVWHAGQPVDIGGPKQRRVLAALATQPGRVVPIDRLVDAVWDGEPPRTARRQVQNAVSVLRQTAVGAVLAAHGPGYILRVPPEQIDAHRFEEHLSRADAARAAGDLPAAADAVHAGLALWQGPALAGVGGRFAEAAEARLEERRLSAIAAWAEISLDMGRHASVVDELVAAVDRHPLREPLACLLMLALHRCGRTAEALVWYHRVRTALAEELGVEPGLDLRRLFERLLATDPTLAYQPVAQARNDLPRDVAHFTGRSTELTRLMSIMDDRGTAVIQAIDGMAGIGKTALAVHAAHRLADRFPDGQLFVDLHGHTAGREPLTADAGLDLLLRAVGVRDEAIPKDLDEKAARWRAAVAGRRILIVLDDVLSPAQVRPLLPGSARCAVLVTSRRRLVGLDGVEVVSLDTLPRPDALALFGRIVGVERTGTEPAAAEEVVRRCGYLPLAIGIVAGWLRARPAWSVEHLAERLADEGRRPALMRVDDHGVAAAFALSYRHLPADQQRLFRLLGLHPGTDTDSYAVAALADLSAETVGPLLDALCDAHLLIQHRSDRYRLHDLVRDYARACGDVDEPEAQRTMARNRLLDYYLHVTEIGADLVAPHRHRLGPRPTYRPTHVPVVSTVSDAWSWFQAEHDNLPAVARLAAQHSTADHGWQIPRNIATYLYRSGHFGVVAAVLEAALAARSPSIGPVGRMVSLSNLALTYLGLGEYQLALEHLSEGLAVAKDTDDRRVVAVLLTLMATLSNLTGSFADGVTYASQAIETLRGRGDTAREAEALAALVEALVRLGRYREAIDTTRRTTDLDPSVNERNVGVLLSRLGTAHSHLGDDDTALRLLTRSLEITRRTRDRPSQASCLHRLADALRKTGRYDEARGHAVEALDILRGIPDPADMTETHNALGAISNDLRRHRDALTHHRNALATAAAIGYRIGEAGARHGIGHALFALGDRDRAQRHWRRAVGLFVELGVPDADLVRHDLRISLSARPGTAACGYGSVSSTG